MKNYDRLGELNINSSIYKTRLSQKFKNRTSYRNPDPKMVLSFIPGTVLEILVKPGQHVKKGDDLMIVDAMKMQNYIKAIADGKVKSINFKKGEKVPKGAALLELD